MAKRTQSQVVGEAGQELVRSIVSSAGGWIIRGQEKDYGVDLEAELADPEALGQLLKFQVKSSLSKRVTNHHVCERVKLSFLRYSAECTVPVIIVSVDLSKGAAHYLWLQEWLEESPGVLDRPAKTVQVRVPSTQPLLKGLHQTLRKIARGETPTQIALNLKGAVRAAISSGNKQVVETISQLLVDMGQNPHFPIEKIIQEVLRIGDRMRGTSEGINAGQILFFFCRKLGEQFTAQHISTLVLRGDSYSRTGISALGILYDEFPALIQSFNLPMIFSTHADPRVAYYCKLRERYLGKSSVSLVSKDVNFKIDGLDLDPEARGFLLEKWANRGDSVFLDYLITSEKVAAAP